MIQVQNLRKLYGDSVAVDDISFEVKQGEIVGLLGPNGAGKTTTMRVITGFFPASSGVVEVNGRSVETHPLLVKRSIGYLPENCPLYQDMKVQEFLQFVAQVRNIKHALHRIREVGKLIGLEDRLQQEIGTLSKGYRQRVGLAQAILHDPDVLILDEPTVGLDPNQIIEIRSLIREIGKKKTVLFSSHILSEVEATCDRLLIINHGKIAASGTIHQLKSQHLKHALIRVTIEGNAKGLVKILEAIPGVSRVICPDLKNEQGFTVFEIETDAADDLRKAITHAVVTGGFSLVEMKKEEKSLEEVFAGFTKT